MKDYVGYEGLCYKVFATPKTWDGAKMFVNHIKVA